MPSRLHSFESAGLEEVDGRPVLHAAAVWKDLPTEGVEKLFKDELHHAQRGENRKRTAQDVADAWKERRAEATGALWA